MPLGLPDAGEPVKGARRRHPGERDDDPAERAGAQRLDTLDELESAVANDADPVGDALDLGERVGGEEHGSSLRSSLSHQLEHLLLHKRVEARGRLIEDE